MPDTSVTEFDQVLGGQPSSGDVIGADEWIGSLVAEAIDQHVPGVLVTQPPHRRILQERAGQDDPVHPACDEGMKVGPLPIGAAVGVAEKDLVSARSRTVLHPSEEAAEERVRDVRDDHSQDQRPLQLQAPGDAIGAVFGLAQERFDPSPGGRRDAQARILVDHA